MHRGLSGVPLCYMILKHFYVSFSPLYRHLFLLLHWPRLHEVFLLVHLQGQLDFTFTISYYKLCGDTKYTGVSGT
jgi:hypothetical protein